MVFRLIISAIVALDIAWWIIADRRLRPLRRRTFWRVLLGLFMGLQLGWIGMWAMSPSLVRSTHFAIPPTIIAGLFLWHLLVLPATILAVTSVGLVAGATRILRFFLNLAQGRGTIVSATTPSPAVQTPPTDAERAAPTRRQFLAAAVVAVPPVVLLPTVAVAMKQLGMFRIRELDLVLPTLPPQLDGMTIAQVSDIHVGRFTTAKMLADVVEATNKLRADLILLTGDLIDFAIADLPIAIDMVKKLDPRHGLAMCMGNHDLIESGTAFMAGVRAAKIPLLVNQSLTFDLRGHAVELLGIPWGHSDAELSRAVHRVRLQRLNSGFPILLAHHPHAFDAASEVGFPLTLAGHTHGGQLMINERIGAGAVLFRYISGTYFRNGNTLVVSNGVGNWFPLRINAPAEILHLTLHRA